MNEWEIREIAPLDESVTGSSMQRDDLHRRPRHDVEEAARRWYGIALDMKNVQDHLCGDLETALNICKHYQGMFAMLDGANDPNLVAVRNLLTKYKMSYTKPKNPSRIFVDGVEITSYPDSVDADAIDDVIELTSEEYYGTQTAELVQTEDGKFHMLPKGEDVAPDVGWEEPPPTTPTWRDRLKWISRPRHG